MKRRVFLGSLGAFGLAPRSSRRLAAATRSFVSSDVAPLKRVIVLRPSASDYVLNLAEGEDVFWGATPEGAIQGHRELERLLAASGAQVLDFEAVLDQAIEGAKKEGQWRTWLRAARPELSSHEGKVTAGTLLARTRDVQFQTDPDGNYRHLADSMDSAWWVRDPAVMTPRGLLIGNFLRLHRRSLTSLLRFAADFASALKPYPIVFDALEEGLIVEGGDLQVAGERTLFMGTGNRSDPRVAPLLARRLEMDVVAVQTRKTEALKWKKANDALRSLFLHLDTCFTHVDTKQALALPYFFEAEYSGRDPLTRLWKGFGVQPSMDEEEASKAVAFLADLGWVRRYQAGSGEEDMSVKGLKLVDFVRREGYTVHFVGGPPPKDPDLEHFLKVVLDEHGKQAANVVATAPGQVVAYEGAARTHAALRAAGIRVSTFPGRELWTGNGGPHCLTLPLERG